MKPSILVLRRDNHAMPVEDYAGAIRRRLPEFDVRLALTPQQERNSIEDVEVVTGSHLEEDVLERAQDLKLFACSYAGTDHLPLDVLSQMGVTVTNASGVHGPNMAEYTIGAILASIRGFHRARRQQDRRVWRHYQTRELQGKTVTVVGLGAIGQAILKRLDGFGVHTIGIRHTPSKGGAADEILGYDPDDLHEALARTDFLVLACPLTELTRGLIRESEFYTLPSHAVLINVARGPIVDTEALLKALRSQDLAGAILDVTDPEPLPEDHPLWGFENVLITPHNSGHTPEYYERLADILQTNLKQIGETGEWTGLRNQILPS